MSLVRIFRNSNRGLVLYRAAIICAIALSILSARNAPTRLPHLFPDSAVTPLAEHDHRLCFDQEDFQWGTFGSMALPIPPPVASPRLNLIAERSFKVVTDGWHYNRPPPIS
jgi:hypothetical protein